MVPWDIGVSHLLFLADWEIGEDLGCRSVQSCGHRTGATVDGKNLATPGAPGAQIFIKILFFGGFEGSGGAWGHHQSTRDEKIPWGSYFGEIWLEL